MVVAHERPDLESSRQDLIREMSVNKGLLSKLEDTLLRELSSATGGWLSMALPTRITIPSSCCRHTTNPDSV